MPQFEEILRKASPRTADAKLLKEELQVLLTHSQVTAVDRTSDDGMISRKQSTPEDTLYRRGESTDRCVLVLSGKVAVYAGRDEFRSELGPWSLIGLDALAQESFVPDYTAVILSENIRYVIMTKDSLRALSEGRVAKPERKRGASSAAAPKSFPSVMGSNASAAMRLRAQGSGAGSGAVAGSSQVHRYSKESDDVENPMWPSAISPLSVENTTTTARRSVEIVQRPNRNKNNDDFLIGGGSGNSNSNSTGARNQDYSLINSV